MFIGLIKSKLKRKSFNKKEMFVFAFFVVLVFALFYYISDYPVEMQRRKNDPNKEHQDLYFIDYFQFSLLSWVTGGTGQQRFSRVDWHWTTRMLHICQMLILLYMILFI